MFGIRQLLLSQTFKTPLLRSRFISTPEKSFIRSTSPFLSSSFPSSSSSSSSSFSSSSSSSSSTSTSTPAKIPITSKWFHYGLLGTLGIGLFSYLFQENHKTQEANAAEEGDPFLHPFFSKWGGNSNASLPPEGGRGRPKGIVNTVASAETPNVYDLKTAAHVLSEQLEALRGDAKFSKKSIWPRVVMSEDRPFIRFPLRPAPSLDLVRLVLGMFQTEDQSIEIRQEHVGQYWTCLQIYVPGSGLVVVIATSRQGETVVSIEKEQLEGQSHDEWCTWSEKELALVVRMYAQGNQDLKQSVSELEKLGLQIYSPNDAISWDDIAGYEDVKSEVQNTIVLALKHPEVYDGITAQTRKMKNSSNLPKAILFEGSPGVGKTQMARVIAASVSVPLVYVPVESVMSKWYGESEKILSQIFDACEKLGEAIIFIDEIDSLATSRSSDMHEATRRVLSVLLRKIEGFEKKDRTIVIGATNRKQDLDEALLSRFDVSIAFRLPSDEERAEILSIYARHLTREERIQLARATPRASGRDLRDICAHAERAWAAAIIQRGHSKNPPPPPPLEEYLASIPGFLAKMGHDQLK